MLPRIASIVAKIFAFVVLLIIPMRGRAIGDVAWEVLAAENPNLYTPPLTGAARRTFSHPGVNDSDGGQVGFNVISPADGSGFWTRQAQGLIRYAQLDTSGTSGPGRSGAESAHVFRNLNSAQRDSGGGGQRVFVARAGDPSLPVDAASYGVWRWDLVHNVEVARTGTDATLGPGLGAGWTFPSVANFTQVRSIQGGRVLLDAKVNGPGGIARNLIARHVPGLGNRPCLLSLSTDPGLAPGLSAGDSFATNFGDPYKPAVDAQGRVFGSFYASGSRVGIWEVCNGAPIARAVDDETGARGPGVANTAAVFSSFDARVVPSGNGFLYFFALARESIAGGSATITGLFRNDGTHNEAIALLGVSGAFSPNWQGSTFSQFSDNTLDAAGSYATFGASVQTAGGGATGLWRSAPGGLQPAAILNLEGAYGPEPGSTWKSFRERSILANGDIVMAAETLPANELAVWLLQIGAAPRRILRPGQNLTLPTVSGPVIAAVSSIALPGEADGITIDTARPASGRDAWIASDGTVLLQVNMGSTYGSVLISARPTNPDDVIFRDGFDG
ncbi:MAG: hypothetical protein ABI411_17360 [Tahibacter sp.]